ncbi:MAG: peroxiredoxin [Opitutaceae bacterium]
MRTFLGLLATACSCTLFTTLRAEPVAVGAPAPAVTGITETGEKLDLGALYPKGYTLVYFFPKADTPGCTAQGCSLRDAYQDLTDKGVTVIGVSTDDVAAQKTFKEKYHFPFTLLADKDEAVIKAFGVPTMEVPTLGKLANRQAFLINREGKVVWRDLKASTKEQANDVLKALKQLGG